MLLYVRTYRTGTRMLATGTRLQPQYVGPTFGPTYWIYVGTKCMPGEGRERSILSLHSDVRIHIWWSFLAELSVLVRFRSFHCAYVYT